MSALYIHIPFCKQACHYCDFHFSTSFKKKDEMVLALVKEMELRKNELHYDPVETIYFGGGTPSLLEIKDLELLIDKAYQCFEIIAKPEITLEANPDDLISKSTLIGLDKGNVYQEYQKIGINRLSIGIQSFFDDDLKMMNRAHHAKDAQNCLRLANDYFENISIDLIYGIPGMSNQRWIDNIEKALSYNIPHISSYALTVEAKTALSSFIKKGIIAKPDDKVAHQHFEIIVNKLTENNFIHYEISNFGKENYFSKNNSSYWLGKKYIGIGPSAHSFDSEKRSWNISNNSAYLKSISEGKRPFEIEILSTTDRYNESVMIGLRTIWGVSLEKIEINFGKKYMEYIHKQSKKHIEKGLLYMTNNSIRTTKKGMFLSDGIASDLFMINDGN